jgi:hypothetical protein
MKKIILILLLSILAVSVVSAQNANLGKFPVGEWLDTNYDAYWVIESDNIILKQNGVVVYEFKDMISDLKLDATMTGDAELSFRCDDTGRSYTFSNKIGSTDIKMMIKKDSGINYDVMMKRQ